MKIMILNLPRTLTEEDVQKLFVPFGAVEACTLVMDATTNISKGFGFIEMADDAGIAAIAALNNTRIKRNKIRVKAA